MFRDALGVEPDKHLDLTNFGWEKLQSALDSAVLSDEAPKLFDKAADRFQEVTAHGEASSIVSKKLGKRMIPTFLLGLQEEC